MEQHNETTAPKTGRQGPSPHVSVIVPVYNREDYLNRCLDSLVNQTLEEIEILAVDDGSTDGSMDILQSYAHRYPGKVFVFRNPGKGAASARNHAISAARGEYITFVDSDDFVTCTAFQGAYQHAAAAACELQVSPYYSLQGTVSEVKGRFVPDGTKECYLRNLTPYMCTKLFRRDLFDRYGPIPELWVGEDAAYVHIVASYVEQFAYYDEPYYYYERNDSSVTQQWDDERQASHAIEGSLLILERCNPAWRDWMRAAVASRLVNFADRRWHFRDVFIAHLKARRATYEHNPIFEQHYARQARKLAWLLALPDEPFPRRVFVNAFGGPPPEPWLEEVRRRAFRDGAEVVQLDAATCPVEAHPLAAQAFAAGDWDFVAGYFAVRRLVDEGGVYLDATVHLTVPLDALRYDPAFFGYLEDERFTGHIFGGHAGNPVLQALLDTYDLPELCDAPLTPLSDRIRTVLVATRGAPLCAATRKDLCDVVLYDPSVFVYHQPGRMHFGFHDFSAHAGEPGYVVLPVGLYQGLLRQNEERRVSAASLAKADRQARKDIARLRKAAQKKDRALAKLKKRVKKLERTLQRMRRSKSWQLTRPLRGLYRLLGRRG